MFYFTDWDDAWAFAQNAGGPVSVLLWGGIERPLSRITHTHTPDAQLTGFVPALEVRVCSDETVLR